MKSINYLQEAFILVLASISVMGSIFLYNNYIEPSRPRSTGTNPSENGPAIASGAPVAPHTNSPGASGLEKQSRQAASPPGAKASIAADTTGLRADEARIKALEQKIALLQTQTKAQAQAQTQAQPQLKSNPKPAIADVVRASASTNQPSPTSAARKHASGPIELLNASAQPAIAAAPVLLDTAVDDRVVDLVAQADNVVRGGPNYWPGVGLNSWNKLLTALESRNRGAKLTAQQSRLLIDALDRLFDSGAQALALRWNELTEVERSQLVTSLSRGKQYVGEARVSRILALSAKPAVSMPNPEIQKASPSTKSTK